MAYTITITSSEQTVNNEGDYVQLQFVFTVNDTGTDVSTTFSAQNILVLDWGELSWDYDIEDALLTVGTYQITLADINDYLFDLFHSGTAASLAMEKQGIVNVYLNGSLEYVGKIRESKGALFKRADKTVSIAIDNGMQKLNEIPLYAEDGAYYEKSIVGASTTATGIVTVQCGTAHALKVGYSIKITNVVGMTDLNRLFKVASIVSDTQFTVELDTAQTYTSDGTMAWIVPYNPLNYTSEQSETYIVTLINKIYQFVNPSLDLSDIEFVQNWEFYGRRQSDSLEYEGIGFNDLVMIVYRAFFEQGLGLSTVGDLIKKLAVDFGCYTGMPTYNKAFFKKLFYYDAGNTQTLGTVLNLEIGTEFPLVTFVRCETSGLVFENGDPQAIEEKRIKRIPMPYCYETASESATNLTAIILGTGATDGTYNVWQVKDPVASTTFDDMGQIIADFWYYYRGNEIYCRVDKFVVTGIDYDFSKNITYDGSKYQIISMKKQISQNISEIEAIYLGEI